MVMKVVGNNDSGFVGCNDSMLEGLDDGGRGG